MRQIKFRAWDKINGRWLELSSLQLVVGEVGVVWGLGGGGSEFYGMHQVELMQYTGLKDKNGKQIYEGDIVKLDSNPHFMITRYDDHYGAFIFENPKNHVDCEVIGLQNKHGDELGELVEREIIGNIYDNPELLASRN